MNYVFQFDPVLEAWPLLLKGTWVTIQLSALSMFFGLIVAVICASVKINGNAFFRFLVNAYIEVIRNTPFIIQLFVFFFALPSVGVKWSAHTAALVAMTVNLGAYASEIVRAGIESIPKGQVEAGRALSLSGVEVFLHIILRPALKAIYPALTSQFIYLMLASSVVSVISADDLTSVATGLQSLTFRSFEIYITVTVIYLLLTLLFSGLFSLIYKYLLDYPDRK
ncbi:amino acid ABC transporter permease [Paenalcaligenes suwonensis]|uniref:amino acid ABC transporter permease n=1 Tax=Paenalcaligenes suwonensis TaxID=1202713 RepID=UPI001407B43A|nr:amino acid ABC transporter permease [Paenalcaligenes suwonensis]NHC60162.1 amino acid ABC transporter permease [Paenalcaligenes suwonensis]